MTVASALAAADRSILVQTGFRNKLINGNFDFWQRGTTQNLSGFRSDDRWANECVGSTIVHSRQEFAPDQTEVPGHPRYYSRTVVTSVTGANNYARKEQRIEDIGTLAGKTATLTFWARASAVRNLSVDLAKRWGLGVFAFETPQKFALTTSWKKYTLRFDVSALLSTVSGNRGSLHLRFWFDAGSSNNARTDTLGHQSGTFDIARAQIEEGAVETPFEERPYATELLLCQRYFEKTYAPDVDPGTVTMAGALTMRQVVGAGAADSFDWRFATTKGPGSLFTITTYNPAAANAFVRNHTASANCTAGAAISGITANTGAYIPFTTAAGSAAGHLNMVHATIDAEIP